MYVKRLKRKCDVRGCKNTDVFAISMAREFGNSVIICKDCLKAALAEVSDYKELPKPTKRETPPPLFFNTVEHIAVQKTEITQEIEEQIDTVTEKTAETVDEVDDITEIPETAQESEVPVEIPAEIPVTKEKKAKTARKRGVKHEE